MQFVPALRHTYGIGVVIRSICVGIKGADSRLVLKRTGSASLAPGVGPRRVPPRDAPTLMS